MRKNKIAALASALCLMQTSLPAVHLTAAAEDALTYGVLKYQIEDSCITVTGCDSKVEIVEIPKEIDGMPVTKIGLTAFYGNAVTSVVIPEGVTDIGSGAFWNCKSLSELTLPSTLTTIEGNAFNNCQLLEKVSIPKSVTAIGSSAFENTPWLAAQKEKSPYVVVNDILIDASEVVSNELQAIQDAKDKEAQDAIKAYGLFTNQVGYFTNLNKKAVLLSDETAGIGFELVNEKGEIVYTGISQPFGFDKDSGDHVHILDFSDFKEEGVYTLRSESGKKSRAFEIGVTDNYSGLLYDALNYFYQNRSGIAIEEKYITSGDKPALTRAAGHAPDVAEIQQVFGYEASSGEQDVTGGWYDAGDHGKYVVNGGVSLWLMQNQYERAALKGTAAAYQDGMMKIPENANGCPDLLDEARYEMEWMLKMIVQDGECQNMAYHKVHDDKWTAIGTPPASDRQKRYLMPPSTAATLNLAACGAQAYRLWKELDPAFAEECLTAAENAYEAAKAHPDMYAPNKEHGGGGAYNDDNVTDEFYWAACELYVSTGDESYYTDLKASEHVFVIPSKLGEGEGITGSFDWGSTAALGSMTLLLHENALTEAENTSLHQNLTAAADRFVELVNTGGYGLPYQNNYIWASNSFITDNAIVLAYAYDQSGDPEYLNSAASAMDYILGRNPLDQSYVTGYGEKSSQYPHHRFWAKQEKASLPKAPCGVMVGGPNAGLEDTIMEKAEWAEDTAQQRYYIDNIQAYSVNECAVNWNTSLAWITGYLCEQNDGILPGQPSAGKQLPESEKNTAGTVIEPVTITIPEGVKAVGQQIFGSKNKDYVKEVIIPESVTTIGKQAFYECKNLERITIPSTIELVGEQAFYRTPWLTEKQADSPMLVINGLLVDGAAVTGDVTIPEGITTILGSAFYMNTKITSIEIPEGVKTIGANAFQGCEALTSIKLPESLETIQSQAFYGAGLTSLTIPASVKKIENEAFVNCKSLLDITVEGTDTLLGTESLGCTVTFTPTGQYSYIFIHSVLDDFVLTCNEGSSAAAYAETTGLDAEYFGDVNRDKAVDLLDIVTLNKHLMIGTPVTPQGVLNADVNRSGLPDPTDSLNILKYLLHLTPSFPV